MIASTDRRIRASADAISSRRAAERLRFALLCGALPFAGGLLVYGLWSLTSWFVWWIAGAAVLVGGIALWLAGIGAWLDVRIFALRAPGGVRARTRIVGAAGALLLLANVPAMLWILGASFAEIAAARRCEPAPLHAYVVEISNESGRPLRDVRLGGVHAARIESLAPGARERLAFDVERAGALWIEVPFGRRTIRSPVDDDVRPRRGEIAEVAVLIDGRATSWVRRRIAPSSD